jgi:putative endonuclease
VFCEVKARTSPRLGPPSEAVTAAKRRKLRALGESYLAARGLGVARCRFDVASVTVRPGGRVDVYVFEDAF